MSLATLSRKSAVGRNAALFECLICGGHHLATGRKASRWQVHRRASATLLVCDGCATPREILRAGEAIPIEIRLWPGLPPGMDVPAEVVA